MKQSSHGQKGGYSLAHNDGCMYKGDDGKFEKYRAGNYHYDMYNGVLRGGAQVGKTVEAANRFYEEHLRDEYNRMLESESWRRNPKRVKTWNEFKNTKQHQLSEHIVQIGDIDNQPSTPEALVRATQAHQRVMEEAGLTVIAIDYHLDEGTPHAHIIYAGLDHDGKMNVDGCLADHGIEKAQPERKYLKPKGKRKQGRWETDKELERRSTRISTLTDMMRTAGEDAADAVLKKQGLPPLDRERSDRDGMTLPEYRKAMQEGYDKGLRDGKTEARKKYRAAVAQAETTAEQTAQEREQFHDAMDEMRAEVFGDTVTAANAKAKPILDAANKRDADSKARKEKLDIREAGITAKENAADTREREAAAKKKEHEDALSLIDGLPAKRAEDKRLTESIAAKKTELQQASDTIAKADAYAKRKREEAEREAQRITGDAQTTAQGIISAAREQAGELLEKIRNRLKKLGSVFGAIAIVADQEAQRLESDRRPERAERGKQWRMLADYTERNINGRDDEYATQLLGFDDETPASMLPEPSITIEDSRQRDDWQMGD